MATLAEVGHDVGMIEPTRLRDLNDKPVAADGKYVVYWLGLSQRVVFNPALEHAVDEANRLKLPVLCCYGIAEDIPDTTARAWTFLLEGLATIRGPLEKRGIAFVAHRMPPVAVALRYATAAALAVCDRNYLAPIKRYYQEFATRAPCRVVQVEGDVVVPLHVVSDKHEIAARTLRPRVYRNLEPFLVPLKARPVKHKAGALGAGESTLDLSDVPKLVASLKTNHRIGAVRRFTGGTAEAERRLRAYLAGPFTHYGAERGKPEAGAASHMSPYLHFGQISPVQIALAVRAAKAHAEDKSAYLEELIVRRELAMNHVEHTPHYDRYGDAVPRWAQKTLEDHRGDKRPFLYTPRQFEHGETHDRYWNAGMSEMRETGYMHNHMRMYWGKKILEWSASPEEAWDTALTLNNRYFLDGRDANSFTNVGWLFGLHDRPWGGRPVYGTVRSMGAQSLKKFDADAYVADVERLVAAEAAA